MAQPPNLIPANISSYTVYIMVILGPIAKFNSH